MRTALFLSGIFLFFLLAATTNAATPSPGWAVDSVATPTNFSPTKGGTYQLEVRNSGSEPSQETSSKGEPTPIVVEDEVPAGLTVTGVPGECSTTGQLVRCVYAGVLTPEKCLSPAAACDAGSVLYLSIGVSVNSGVASEALTNKVTVSGGGAREASSSFTNAVSAEPPSFGAASFDFDIDGPDGAIDSEAGGHPYQLTSTIDFNSAPQTDKDLNPYVSSVQDPRDIIVDLPLGFVASTLAAPECTLSELSSEARCPGDTIIGHIRTEPDGRTGEGASSLSIDSPIWNLTPQRGVPAEFGYVDGEHNPHVFFAHVVPSATGYVLQTTATELPQIPLAHIVVTFYSDPAQRDASGNAQIPFFTNPTACGGGPLTATLYIDSWQNPGSYNADGTPDLQGDSRWVKATSQSPAVTGCDELQFTPELFAQPTTTQADSPSGLEFELKVPQSEEPQTHATPALKNATVVLPEGMTVDPSAANGLEACSADPAAEPGSPGNEIGWLGPDGPHGEPLPGGGALNFSPAASACPEASKIGSLELETPLIGGVLHGEIYLAAQDENPFGSVLAGYVVVNDPTTGVVLKIAGVLQADPSTGQITGVFSENPQLPFSDLKLHFFAGPRAELATPEACGAYTTTSALEPWSGLQSGPLAMPFDSFAIGAGCATGFAPAFTAGSTNLQAGAYTPFVVAFERQDDERDLGGASVSLPPGLLADVGSVPECDEAQIQQARAGIGEGAGGCPENTKVGTVTAGAGPGPNPLFVTGNAYLTGPYNGGPYGLAVVVPAVAGPFHLGNVVVRQSLRIDPRTAAVTDVSDPFPAILDPVGTDGQTAGIPIKLRRVDVRIDRAGFTFNPTSCAKFQVAGAIVSTQGLLANLATPFQVTNCATLKFAPRFTVSTSGKTSKKTGASLTAKVAYGRAGISSLPQGTYADVARVKVELPKALPSRLTTLQKACTAAQFEANPAGCPSASKIGYATVHTPILAGALTGPAIFVSHGGEAFPSLIMVLQGYGVTIDLVGTTFISRAGITSTTFKMVPDAPFTTFDLTLPEGKFSALAANGNLCKPTVTKTVSKKLTVKVHGRRKTEKREVQETVASPLQMPNEFIAQNGAAIRQTTTIAVTGCPPTRGKAKNAAKKHMRAPKKTR